MFTIIMFVSIILHVCPLPMSLSLTLYKLYIFSVSICLCQSPSVDVFFSKCCTSCAAKYTVKPVLTDHCHERPPVLKDHTFLAGPTLQYTVYIKFFRLRQLDNLCHSVTYPVQLVVSPGQAPPVSHLLSVTLTSLPGY